MSHPTTRAAHPDRRGRGLQVAGLVTAVAFLMGAVVLTMSWRPDTPTGAPGPTFGLVRVLDDGDDQPAIVQARLHATFIVLQPELDQTPAGWTEKRWSGDAAQAARVRRREGEAMHHYPPSSALVDGAAPLLCASGQMA